MRAIPNETVSKAIHLYREGLTFEQVAARVGHCRDTIARAFKRSGEPSRPRNTGGSRNGRWSNGIRYSSGYIRQYIPDDHRFALYRCSDKSLMQHRLRVMEHLDRPLENFETVHHINGNKTDNRIENLQIIIGSHGQGIALCCGQCGSTNLVPVQRGN